MNKHIIGFMGKKRSGKDTAGDYLVKYHGYKKYAFASSLKEICKSVFSFTDEQLNGDEKEVIDDYWGLSPRQALQYVGTDLFRNQISSLIPNMGNDIWVNVLERKLKEETSNIVITDIRFENERAMVKRLGGIIVKIHSGDIWVADDVKMDYASHDYINITKVDGNVDKCSGKVDECSGKVDGNVEKCSSKVDECSGKVDVCNNILQNTALVTSTHSSEQNIDTMDSDYIILNNYTKEELYRKVDNIMEIHFSQ